MTHGIGQRPEVITDLELLYLCLKPIGHVNSIRQKYTSEAHG